MISQKLLCYIEDHAPRLTIDLVNELHSDPRTVGYRVIPAARLTELKSELYRNLSQWLSRRSALALESRYTKLGRERYLYGIPLSQAIFALNRTKSLLLDYIGRATPGTPEELRLEHELVLAISEFFDQATYHSSIGYEDARRAELAAPKQAAIEKRPRPNSTAAVAAGIAEIDLHISRGGDVGEVSG